MDIYSFVNKLNLGAFGSFLLVNEFKVGFGDLPDLPFGYKLPEVYDNNDVDNVFKYMKGINKQIDNDFPNAGNVVNLGIDDYETQCFLLELMFTNIFNYWFGNIMPSHESYNDNSVWANFDLMCLTFWDYIQDECSLEELKVAADKFVKSLI